MGRFFQTVSDSDLWREFKDALFMDFLSLPQVDSDGKRTDEEDLCFKIRLSMINFLYGSQKTVVLQLTVMSETPFDGMNATPYSDRGWCTFEETTAGIIKPKNMVLNLGLAEEFLFD